jgi:hypothetical protein
VVSRDGDEGGAGETEKARVLALRRKRLQRLSWISMLDILISAVVLILATYARAGRGFSRPRAKAHWPF